MPKQKDLKRLVRTRMEKTGEAYAAARAQVLRKQPPAPKDRPHVPPSGRPSPPSSTGNPAALAGMSDAAVAAKTGKTWSEWVVALDAVGAVDMPHREIAAGLARDHDLSAWWSQTVTVGYERIRGLRDVGQRRGGGYEVNKSRTIAVGVDTLFRAVHDARWRRRWLPESLAVSTANRNKSLRGRLGDGTRVQFYFTAKGEAKSGVSVQLEGLPAKAEAERLKVVWSDRLAALAALLVGKP